MDNGHSKTPIAPEIIVPEPTNAPVPLMCHRFFAPVVVPQPDRIDPRRVTIQANLGNFACIGAKCTLWNAEAKECWDVTARKGQAIAGQYAYNRMNDVTIEGGGD
jgi:hypothetical protein